MDRFFVSINSYLRYKCKKLSFIARTGLKYDRGTREYFKECECNKGTFYTYVLQHFIYDHKPFTFSNYFICDFLNCDNVTTTSACVDRHVLPALFSTQFVNKVYEFKTPFVKWKQIFEKM
jgi:hypothetical protein